MEARLGNMGRAREIFQEGVWANPTSKSVDRIWHAWGVFERRAGFMELARKYFQ